MRPGGVAAGVRPLAVIVTTISMGAVLALYWIGGRPPAKRTTALADLAGMPILHHVAQRAMRAG